VTNLAADSIGMLDLADLGAYSSIVWHEDDLVDVSAPYLWRTDISKYLNFGGKILYTGYLPTKAFANTSSYPTILQPGEMVFDDLGIFKTDRKLFSRFSGALPAVSGYPALNCDSSKTDAALEYHLTNIESIVPTSSARTIYDYDSRYDSASLMGSMKGLPVGLEFTGSGHKAVVLAFPLYFLNQAQASSVMKYVLLDRFSEVLKVTEDDKAIPKEFLLKQNYPNPFNPTTTFLFELSAAGPVRLMVYDLLGKEVARLIDSRLESGRYQLMWDASRIPSGVYFYSLASGAYTITKRMVLLK
jgi:hypothetical protein